MEKLAECRPLSVVLTRLQPSEINKWRHRRPHKRRKAQWQKGIVKKYKAKKKPAEGRKISESSSLLDDSETNSSRSIAISNLSVSLEPERAAPEIPLFDTAPENPLFNTAPENPPLDAAPEEPLLDVVREDPQIGATPGDLQLDAAPEDLQLDAAPEEPKASTVEDASDALPLWKYKRKRKRSTSSTRSSDEFVPKKLASFPDANPLKIRLKVVNESQAVVVDDSQEVAVDESQAAVMDESQEIAVDESQAVAVDESQADVVDQSQAVVVDESQSVVVDESQAVVVDESQAVVVNESQAVVMDESQAVVMDQSQAVVVDQSQAVMVDESQAVVVENDVDTDTENFEEAASLIMDSCDSPVKGIEAESEQRAEGHKERVERSVNTDSPKSKDYFTPDEIIIEEEFHELKESLETSDPHYVSMSAISDEEDSDDDVEDRLMDLCLGQDAKVLVTRLEDVAQALERNHVPSDVVKLTSEDLTIIRNFRSLFNASDDTSYCLAFSPNTESTESEESSGESEELSSESESDDSILLPRLRPRVRRRIISDDSDTSDTDPMDLVPVKPRVLRAPRAKAPENLQAIASSPKSDLTSQRNDESPRSTLTPQRSVEPPRVDPVNEQFENSIEQDRRLNCSTCNEMFDSAADQLSHACSLPEKKLKRSHKSKKDRRIRPKLSEPQCTVCSQHFDSNEELSKHIFKHTTRELQDAYKAARLQNRNEEDVEVISNADDPPEEPQTPEQTAQPGVAMMVKEKSPKKLKKKPVPVAICPCHTNDLEPTDLTVQIEMILFCEICKVLFRRHECFETHYRSNAKCAEDRRRGRVPRLFCSTCRVVLNTLSDMRKHLEEHANINRHGTVTFVCNICRVVFFGVGTVFCTHWFNHEKDPMFVASRWSFPKLCVTNRGRNPQGTTPGEQFLFVAEYVCRFCKLQFSSDGELSNHIAHNCQVEQRASLPTTKPKKPELPVAPPTPPVAPVPPQRPRIPPGSKKNVHLREWICDICDKRYEMWDDFERHAAVHFSDATPADYVSRRPKTFKCTVCPREYNILEPLGRHGLNHDCIRYHCTICQDNYYTFAAFSRHVTVLCRSHSPSCRLLYGTSNVCRICNTVRADSKALVQHQMEKHGSSVETLPNVVMAPSKKPMGDNDKPTVNQVCPVVPVTSQAVDPLPLVVSVQPPAEPAQVNPSYIINIALPNSQSAEKPKSPPKVVRALEDPTVQVVLRQPNASDANISASLVTDGVPSHGRTSAVASTFTLTMTDTTSTGARVTAAEPTPLPADRISDADIAAVLQDLVPTDDDPSVDTDKAAAPTAANRTLLEALLEGNSAASSDDVQIIEVSEAAKELTVVSPKKTNPAPPVDSDVEILSNASGRAKKAKEPSKPDTDESSESSGEVTLVKNPLSKPQGFLRVKKLADLQEGGSDQGELKTGRSLTEHLIANSRLAKSPAKSAGLNGSSAPSPSNGPHVPGKRTLPMIPQRAVGSDARRANPLPSNPAAKPMNRVTPIPTNTVSPNVSRSAAPQPPSNAESSNSGENRQLTPSKYTCPLCPQFNYPTLNDFVNHLYQHPNMPSSVQDLVHYLRNKSDGASQQKQQSQPTYKCLVCSAYETESAVEFQKHIATHNPQCLTSSTPVAYSQQMNTLSSQLEYTPVYMQYSYQVQPPSQPSQQIALSSSNGMSPVLPQIYTCHICSNFHVTSCDELQKHIQTTHPVISTTIYACLNCPQTPTFANEQLLKHHEDTHHPYVCSICLQRFTSTYELNVHCDVNHKGQYGA